MEMYLGLDLGTSGLKALLLDANGDIVASNTQNYPVSQPQPGWSEQDPALWIAAAKSALSQIASSAPEQVAGTNAISFSGQMHGAVAVDIDGNPIRPCILWNDMRSAAEAEQLDKSNAFHSLAGNIAFPGFTAPKLLWMQTNEPDNYSRIHKVLLPKDYLAFWLTGKYGTDVSDAAGTGWLDVARRCWSDTLIAAGGMQRAQMPDLVEGCDVMGTIRPELAREIGMNERVQIVAGGADNAVAACGVGAINDGQGFVSLGTSGVILAARNSYAPAPASAVHTFCHAIPDRWYQMGVILSATSSLNWLADMLGKTVIQTAELVPDEISGPSNVIFLPYLSGERTPHNDANIGGAFIGLKSNTSDTDLCQAVMEGVCFALRDCLEALRSTGSQIDELLAIGGGGNSQFWLESLATILGVRLKIPDKGEYGAAMGAARLAMIGAGAQIGPTLTPPTISKTIKPRADLMDEYEEAYRRYVKLYPAIKDIT